MKEQRAVYSTEGDNLQPFWMPGLAEMGNPIAHPCSENSQVHESLPGLTITLDLRLNIGHRGLGQRAVNPSHWGAAPSSGGPLNTLVSSSAKLAAQLGNGQSLCPVPIYSANMCGHPFAPGVWVCQALAQTLGRRGGYWPCSPDGQATGHGEVGNVAGLHPSLLWLGLQAHGLKAGSCPPQ